MERKTEYNIWYWVVAFIDLPPKNWAIQKESLFS